MAEGHNYGGEVGPWLRVIRWRHEVGGRDTMEGGARYNSTHTHTHTLIHTHTLTLTCTHTHTSSYPIDQEAKHTLNCL